MVGVFILLHLFGGPSTFLLLFGCWPLFGYIPDMTCSCTDNSYFFFPHPQVPKSVCQYSHPGVALHTVKEIARLKDVPLPVMLAILRRNTNKIYDLS